MAYTRNAGTSMVSRQSGSDNHIELAEPLNEVLYVDNKGSLQPKVRQRPVLKMPTPIEYKTPLHIKVATVLLFIFMAMGIGLVVINWLIQCGEPIYYADRTWTTGECILIPYTPVSGRW